MKIKGLKKAYQALFDLEEALEEKIDSVDLGESQDDYYSAGLDLVEEAKQLLDDLKELKLSDF